MTELQLLAKRQQYKTNHILHLLLALITVGFWVPVWILVAVSNWNERVKVDKKLSYIVGHIESVECDDDGLRVKVKPSRYMSDGQPMELINAIYRDGGAPNFGVCIGGPLDGKEITAITKHIEVPDLSGGSYRYNFDAKSGVWE